LPLLVIRGSKMQTQKRLSNHQQALQASLCYPKLPQYHFPKGQTLDLGRRLGPQPSLGKLLPCVHSHHCYYPCHCYDGHYHRLQSKESFQHRLGFVDGRYYLRPPHATCHSRQQDQQHFLVPQCLWMKFAPSEFSEANVEASTLTAMVVAAVVHQRRQQPPQRAKHHGLGLRILHRAPSLAAPLREPSMPASRL
jgi:hypothetical protein